MKMLLRWLTIIYFVIYARSITLRTVYLLTNSVFVYVKLKLRQLLSYTVYFLGYTT